MGMAPRMWGDIRMQRRAMLGWLGLAGLSACAGPQVAQPVGLSRPVPGLGPYEGLSCVPYARTRSGIALRGDAWQWWAAADGRYPRGQRPAPGAVLVLARSSRLREGHVAVVREVVSAREIRVDHANWASGALRGRVALDQPVLDVSARNDWTAVRVWYPRTASLGATVFPAHGFIMPRSEMAAARLY